MNLLDQESHELVSEQIRKSLKTLVLDGRHGAQLAELCERSVLGGKMMRPALVKISYSALSGARSIPEDLWQLAAAYELLHAAFVVHDDIIDNDTFRRGVLNVRGLIRARSLESGISQQRSADLGDAAALLVGDLLLYAASRTVFSIKGEQSIQDRLRLAFDEAISRSAIGEFADVLAVDDVPDAADSSATALEKTAIYSFCAPLRAGAILAGASVETEMKLDQIGRELGTAFQLVDDLIGAFGSTEQAGRDPGADLREGKQTVLLALARDSSNWSAVQKALALAHTGPLAVVSAQKELELSGARDLLSSVIEEHLRQARAEAAELGAEVFAAIDSVADSIEKRIP